MIRKRPTQDLVILLACGGLFLAGRSACVDARPIYKKAFDDTYNAVRTANKTTCLVCHARDDKRKRNHYGKALAEELGEKNVREYDKIVSALRAIEEQKCKSGKWQERLDRGLIPCECGEFDTDSYIARQLARGQH